MAQSIIFKDGDIIHMNRGYKQTPDYSAPQDFAVRNSNETITYLGNNLGNLVPITDGIVLDTALETTGWSANSSNDIEQNTITRRKGPSALSVIKNDTSDNEVIANKTIDPFNFTDREFWGFVYVSEELLPELQEEDALEIRLEEDTSNYISQSFDREHLHDGWNILVFDDETYDTTGTPDITAITGLRIIFRTTEDDATTVADDFVFDELKAVAEEDFFKPFVSGYPVLDEATNEATIRKYLTSNEAVGFNISGIAMYNRDATRRIHTGSTFPSEPKTFDNEFTIIQKNRQL